MSLFKRRPKPSPPKLSEVYVSYYPSKGMPTSIRFFFMEALHSEPSEEALGNGYTRYRTGEFYPGARELLDKIKAATNASSLNTHRQYIATHWWDGTAPENTEDIVVEMLAQHFGWVDPLVDYFDYPSAKKSEVERLRRVRWSPSS